MRPIQRLATASVLLLACPALSQPPALESFLILKRDAVGPGPPVPIAGSVEKAAWSSDGRYVLAIRNEFKITPALVKEVTTPGAAIGPPPGESALILWNRDTRKLETLWMRPLGQGEVSSVAWLAGTQTAIVATNEPLPLQPNGNLAGRTVIHRLHAPTRTLRTLFQIEQRQFRRVAASPDRPIAAILMIGIVPRKETRSDGRVAETSLFEQSVAFAGERGEASGPFRLGEQDYISDSPWDRSGRVRITRVDRSGQRLNAREVALDPRTGVVQPAEPEENRQEPKPEVFVAVMTQQVSASSNARSVKSLWLMAEVDGERRSSLVSGDANWGEISPKADAVIYTSRGILSMAELIRIPKEAYLAARAAAERAVTMSHAKQIGLALHMYAQDFDETFPGSGDDVVGKIRPYLGNSEFASKLVFTFPGGTIASIKEPNKTELGYVPGAGGRAIIFADGHVQWKADE